MTNNTDTYLLLPAGRDALISSARIATVRRWGRLPSGGLGVSRPQARELTPQLRSGRRSFRPA